MPIFKAPNDDTCMADVAPDGWVEITESALHSILASRTPIPGPPTKQQQIDALLAQYGIAQEWQLDRDIGNSQLLAQILGIPEPQLYAANAGYHLSKELKARIDAIKAKA